eukprot:3798838-Prymnesium_polylepis.2
MLLRERSSGHRASFVRTASCSCARLPCERPRPSRPPPLQHSQYRGRRGRGARTCRRFAPLLQSEPLEPKRCFLRQFFRGPDRVLQPVFLWVRCRREHGPVTGRAALESSEKRLARRRARARPLSDSNGGQHGRRQRHGGNHCTWCGASLPAAQRCLRRACERLLRLRGWFGAPAKQ